MGVIVSTLLIQFYGWTGFDPIASIFIAVLIAASVIPLVIDTGKVLALDVAQRGDGIADALGEVRLRLRRRLLFSSFLTGILGRNSLFRSRDLLRTGTRNFGPRTRAA